MIINSIILDNFKSHKHSKIELNKGISLILGKNGAGKSSIFEAISYSFFKSFDGKIEEIIRKSAEENDVVKEMKVTVEFTAHGIHYKLERGKNSKNIAKLYKKDDDDLKILCDGDTEVTNEIKAILGLDSKSFKNAVYIKQGDITELIDKQPSERKEFIAKLLNIDDAEKSWNEMKNIIRIYEDKKTLNAGQLAKKEDLEEYIRLLKENIRQNESKLNKNNSEIETLKKDLESLEEKVQESDDKKNKFNELKNNLNNQRIVIDKLESDKNHYDNKLLEIEKYEEASKELKKYVDKLPYYNELKDKKTQLNTFKSELKHKNKEIDKINNNMKLLEDNKESYIQYETIENELRELEDKRKIMAKQVSNNQINKTKFDEKINQKNKLSDTIRQTSDYASRIFNENFYSTEEVENKVEEEKTKTESTIRELNNKINYNKTEISARETEFKTTKKSLNDLENTRDICPICQSSITHEKHEELSNQYKKTVTNLTSIIKELKNENNKLEDELNRCETYLEKINKINLDKLKENYAEFECLRDDIKKLKESLPEIEKDESELNNIDIDLDEKRKKKNDLKDNYTTYIAAKQNLENTDIEQAEKDKEELNSIIHELKYQCINIVQKCGATDNLEKTIEYAEKKSEEYHKYQGAIGEKDSYLKLKEDNLKEISDKTKEYHEIELECNNLEYHEEDNKKLHDDYILQNENLQNIEKNVIVLNTNNKRDNETLKEKTEELEELNKIALEQENIEDYIKLLNKIRDLYSKDGVQKIMREYARPNIEKNTVDIFNDFDFEYTALKMNEDYDIMIENKNEVLDINMMSGGEKIAIALALRLGIARVVSKNKTELLLLDEPTIHLDDERRDRLIEIIGKNTIVPQMIVVTHDDGMEALSNNIIKINKSNGISYVDNS